MAGINNDKFVKFLIKINVDISQFSDSSFDDVCNEESLQHFLAWLCNNFDKNNVIDTYDREKTSPPRIEDTRIRPIVSPKSKYKCKILKDVQIVEENRIKKSTTIRQKMRSLEEKLCVCEKAALAKFNDSKKTLANDLDMNKSETLETVVNNVYGKCLSRELYFPNLDLYLNDVEKSLGAVKSFKECHINKIQNAVRKEMAKADAIIIDDLENLLVNYQQNLILSLREFPVDCKLQNISNSNVTTVTEMASAIVTKRLKYRKKCELLRNIGDTEYLYSALNIYREMVMERLVMTLLGRAFMETLMSRTTRLSQAYDDYIESVTAHGDFLENVIEQCLAKRPCQDCVDGIAIAPVNPANDSLALYSKLLKTIANDGSKYHEWRNNTSVLVARFRSGPTLGFCFTPVPLALLYEDCKELQEKVNSHLRHLASAYMQLKSGTLRHSDRHKQLLWKYFLVDPSKLISMVHECSSFLPSSSMLQSDWQ